MFNKKLSLKWTRIRLSYPGPKIAVLVVILSGLLSAQLPETWEVNVNEYEYLMTITGVAVINGVESANSENVIAAFVNNECRGVAYPTETQGRQLYFMMVYSNTNAETLTFKLYNAGIDSILNVSETIIFSVNERIGTVDAPYEFIANYYVNSIEGTVTERFNLLTNYPNPFNNSTNIRFRIKENAFIQLSVFNLNGEHVITLVNEKISAGDIVSWDSKNASGADCPSGEYIIQLMTNNTQSYRKMTMIK